MYCTLEDLNTVVSQNDLVVMTNDSPTARTVDEGFLQDVIADASAFIDGYIRGRYALPFENVPTAVRSLCKELTYCALRGRRIVDNPTLSEQLRLRRKAVVDELEKIQSGIVKLDVGKTGESAPLYVRVSEKTALFPEQLLSTF